MRLTDTLPDFTGSFLDDDRYELVDCLGSGAYGKVYKAIERTSSSQSPNHFAVKCLLKPEAGSRQEEFQLREIALHKKVSGHPNIVAIHEVLYDDFFLYVILDLCEGGDLFAAITETESFKRDNESIRSVFVQLLDAVQHCHDLGVYHRDLKPENVLLSKDGKQVRIADFGLATDVRTCQEFGCGSSYYMSPECIGKESYRTHYSPRQNDIWSLGVILVNLITARNPWSFAVSTDEHFSRFLYDEDFIQQLLPISDGANRILRRIFDLNPLRRTSISKLRNEVLALETFHRDPVPHPGRTIVSEAGPRNVNVVTVFTEQVPTGEEESNDGSLGLDSSSLCSLGPTPINQLLPLPNPPHISFASDYERFSNWCGSPASDSDYFDAESGSELGPETPASKAVELEVDIADMEISELKLDGEEKGGEAETVTPKIKQEPFQCDPALRAIAKAAVIVSPKYLTKPFSIFRKL
ncbi:serine threonine protein kinase [Moniliophthora roreri]|uniref:Protein kinase domain-containing protein n=1 Tax=Moniliophthora roreri TaxID=221103 RepID=A0A0W0GCW8_MONRR|nr:serine threonine protein kinase [Moniliophthora roreri]